MDVLIVGAGIAGLCAAERLRSNGGEVLVVDKGRGFGGRMANRRMDDLRFDHGAQFMTAKSEVFRDFLIKHESTGVLRRWEGMGEYKKTNVSYWYGAEGMTSLPKEMAKSLEVKRSSRLIRLSEVDGGWKLHFEQGDELLAHSIICTAPVPQFLKIAKDSELHMDALQQKDLEAITYDPCFAVMASLKASPFSDTPFAQQFDAGPIAWIADNWAKGISPQPSMTVHSTGEYARAHWHDPDRQARGQDLLEHLKGEMELEVVQQQTHGWLYSKVTQSHKDRFIELRELPRLLLAGDAFGSGANVEAAALSGWAAADALLS